MHLNAYADVSGKRIIVDTNIPVEILHEISDYHHVAIMLSPQAMSVERFFDRDDPEKKFLFEQISIAKDPEKIHCTGALTLIKLFHKFTPQLTKKIILIIQCKSNVNVEFLTLWK